MRSEQEIQEMAARFGEAYEASITDGDPAEEMGTILETFEFVLNPHSNPEVLTDYLPEDIEDEADEDSDEEDDEADDEDDADEDIEDNVTVAA